MNRLLGFFLLTVAVVLGAEDAWTKVRQLKHGAEIRVFKKDVTQPVLGKFDELTSDHLVVLLKNGQVAIARDDIDRLDARPGRPVSRFAKEDKSTTASPEGKELQAAPQRGVPRPIVSSGTNVTIRSKPDFENLYRRKPSQ